MCVRLTALFTVLCAVVHELINDDDDDDDDDDICNCLSFARRTHIPIRPDPHPTLTSNKLCGRPAQYAPPRPAS